MESTDKTDVKGTADTLKFDSDQFAARLESRFMSSLGWPQEVANRAAQIAGETLMQLYGGSQQYIPKRKIDKQAIVSERESGKTVGQISREHAVSTRTVLNYTKR